MVSRTKGRSTRNPDKYRGLEVGWKNFAEFREWAVKNGFSKLTNSPDRQDILKGYTPDNVKFVIPSHNFGRYYPEPPEPEVPF